MLRFHDVNRYLPGQITLLWTESTLSIDPVAQAVIDAAWLAAAARPGVILFDGLMCRLERLDRKDQRLQLSLSRTNYKTFFGTNMAHPELAQQFGDTVLGNALGVSCVVQTADDWLLLGMRSAAVAYYPNRIHTFAGALEPRENLDVFDEARRELREETGLTADQITSIVCTGLAEDVRLRQPELIFTVQTSRSRDQIRASLAGNEHGDLHALGTTQSAIQAALADPRLTPVACATLALWGKSAFGDAWFAPIAARLTASPS